MDEIKNNFSSYYDLEVDNLANEIIKNNYKLVLLQFPDGLKYYGHEVIDYLREKASGSCEFFIYMGSCFGACDIPLHLKDLGFDLCVQWGHNEFKKTQEGW